MNRLKQLRTEKRLLQEDIAKLIGVTNSCYGYYENEKRSIPDEIKLKLCEYFDCSLDYLMGLSNERKSKEESKQADKKFIAFYNGYKDMDSADQKMLDDIFNSIVERNKNKNNKN